MESAPEIITDEPTLVELGETAVFNHVQEQCHVVNPIGLLCHAEQIMSTIYIGPHDLFLCPVSAW